MNVDQIKKELEVFKGVRLDETSHTYFITDSSGCTIQAKISMTTLISKYCRKFNTEEEAIRYANKYNKNVIDVLAEWEFENKFACEKGTAIHNYMEHMFKGLPDEYMYDVERVVGIFGEDVLKGCWEKLKSLGRLFKSLVSSYIIPIACELKIYDPETGVAGAVDMLAYHIPTKSIIIIDYKSCKEIERKNIYYNYMLKPFDYLDDINYIHYSLQMNGYQYIIEKNTNLKLNRNHFLIWINEKNDDVEFILTRNLYKEASIMIENERNI